MSTATRRPPAIVEGLTYLYAYTYRSEPIPVQVLRVLPDRRVKIVNPASKKVLILRPDRARALIPAEEVVDDPPPPVPPAPGPDPLRGHDPRGPVPAPRPCPITGRTLHYHRHPFEHWSTAMPAGCPHCGSEKPGRGTCPWSIDCPTCGARAGKFCRGDRRPSGHALSRGFSGKNDMCEARYRAAESADGAECGARFEPRVSAAGIGCDRCSGLPADHGDAAAGLDSPRLDSILSRLRALEGHDPDLAIRADGFDPPALAELREASDASPDEDAAARALAARRGRAPAAPCPTPAPAPRRRPKATPPTDPPPSPTPPPRECFSDGTEVPFRLEARPPERRRPAPADRQPDLPGQLLFF